MTLSRWLMPRSEIQRSEGRLRPSLDQPENYEHTGHCDHTDSRHVQAPTDSSPLRC